MRNEEDHDNLTAIASFSREEFDEMLTMAGELHLLIYVAVVSNGLFGTSDYGALSHVQRAELVMSVRPIVTYAYAQMEIGGDGGLH